MKNLLKLLFLSLSIVIYSQNIQVIYQLTYKINKEDKTNVKTENFILKEINGTSYFSSYNFLVADSIKQNSNSIENIYKIPKTKFYYTIEKKLLEKKMKYHIKVASNKFSYLDEITPFQWKLEKEEKMMEGYLCKKATTHFAGRNYIAWYTEEVPISDGPYKFNGLPGLILEIYDDQNDYQFKVIQLKKNAILQAFNNQKYLMISKKEFQDFEKNIKENPSLALKNGPLNFSDETMKMIEAKIKSNTKNENNPLELLSEK